MGLSLKHVYKQFPNGKKAVSDFCIEIPNKEFIVIVGPSGCGKTTLLRLIAGLETPTEGEIILNGEKVNDLKPKDRSVTLVFQNYALFPYMTAYENIAFGLKIAGLSKTEIDAKVMEAAEILGIKNELNSKPRELSGGQCQRVALGRAMVSSPKIFLLDEPLSNLDAKLRTDMRAQISDLYDRLDATFVYVTHDQVEAMTMGSRIVVMKDGVVQQIDTPQRIYNKPANKFVASFIGTPEMNFLDGVLKKEKNGVRLTMCGQEIMLPLDMFSSVNPKFLSEQSIIVGVRAEDIAISPGGIKAVVKSIDVLGKELIVYTQIGGADVTLKTTQPVKKGEHITVSFGQNLHFFSAETEMNIFDYAT